MASRTNSVSFSPLVENALRLSSFWHRGQYLQGGEFEYFIHPSAVAQILARSGFDEPVVAAGFCHDLLVHTQCSEEEISSSCSGEVLNLVKEVTLLPQANNLELWQKERKAYFEQIKTASQEAKAVATADRLHALHLFIALLDTEGLECFNRFFYGPEEKLWYEDHFYLTVSQIWKHRLLEEYNVAVDSLVELLEELDAKQPFKRQETGEELADADEPVVPVDGIDNNPETVGEVLDEVKELLKKNLLSQETLMQFIKQQSQKIEQLKTRQPKASQPENRDEPSPPVVQSGKYLREEELRLILPVALQLGIFKGQLSNGLLQKHLKVPYATAYRVLKELKRLHVISKVDSPKPRPVDKTQAEMLLKNLGV